MRRKPTDRKISPALAATQGAAATALGMLAGSAIYNDIEHYTMGDTTCGTAVLRFLSAWTTDLRRHGYLSGAYVNLHSGAVALVGAYKSTTYARPPGRDLDRPLRQESGPDRLVGIADARWANHQRAKQYLADQTERHGGLAIAVDRDRVDAPVATVRDGRWVSDYYAATPSNTTFSGPAKRC